MTLTPLLVALCCEAIASAVEVVVSQLRCFGFGLGLVVAFVGKQENVVVVSKEEQEEQEERDVRGSTSQNRNQYRLERRQS